MSRFYYEIASEQREMKETLLDRALAEDLQRDCVDARRAAILLSLAQIYSHTSRLAKAEDFASQSLQIYKSISLHNGVADANGLLARIYIAERKFAPAESILSNLLNQDQFPPEKLKDDFLVAAAHDHLDLALIKYAQGNEIDGRLHIDQAEKLQVNRF